MYCVCNLGEIEDVSKPRSQSSNQPGLHRKVSGLFVFEVQISGGAPSFCSNRAGIATGERGLIFNNLDVVNSLLSPGEASSRVFRQGGFVPRRAGQQSLRKAIPAWAGRGLENRWSREAWSSTLPAFRQDMIPVAQRIERRITNPQAAGLNPAGDASMRRGCSRARSDLTPLVPVTVASTQIGEMAEWIKALAC